MLANDNISRGAYIFKNLKKKTQTPPRMIKLTDTSPPSLLIVKLLIVMVSL